MKLIIAEKNDAARQIAERLSTGKPKKDKVYNTAIYRFEWKGEECVTIGLAGHILAPDFCDSVLFDKKLGWYSVTEDGEMLPADMPDGLARPPYDTKRKPFLADGISIKGWKLESLPYRRDGNRRRGDQALSQAAAAHAVCDHLAAGCRRSRGHLACAYHAHRRVSLHGGPHQLPACR